MVEAVGPEVRHGGPECGSWRPRRRAFAEYVAVHPALLQPVPDHVPLEEMLAYPVNLRTAYYMVYVWAKVREAIECCCTPPPAASACSHCKSSSADSRTCRSWPSPARKRSSAARVGGRRLRRQPPHPGLRR